MFGAGMDSIPTRSYFSDIPWGWSSLLFFILNWAFKKTKIGGILMGKAFNAIMHAFSAVFVCHEARIIKKKQKNSFQNSFISLY